MLTSFSSYDRQNSSEALIVSGLFLEFVLFFFKLTSRPQNVLVFQIGFFIQGLSDHTQNMKMNYEVAYSDTDQVVFHLHFGNLSLNANVTRLQVF